MHDLGTRFQHEWRRQALADSGQHVLVACSGGLDSVALLHLLRFAADDRQVVSVAHFDHRMRSGSTADAEWVRGLCQAWDLPLQVGCAASAPVSEAGAREARYQFLETTADAIGADRIATAHHADDQVETVLFRLLRGTGLDGLAGIPMRRGRIIRPLISFWRAELEDYARSQHLSWREDPTNASRGFARNRIRLDVVPALEREWPGARRALYCLAQEAAASRRAWSAVLREIEERIVTFEDSETIELARPLLLEYHPEIRTRLLRRWLARLGPAPNRSGTGAVAAFITSGASGSGIQLKGGLSVEREFDIVRVGRVRPAAGADRPLEITSTNAGSGETMIGGTRYRIRWSIGADGDGLDTVAVDPEAVHFPLAIRSWQPGDRIGLPIGSKKLKKLFTELRLGRRRRRTVPVLVDRTGRVLWVAGLARSTAARPLPDHSALCITVSDGDTN